MHQTQHFWAFEPLTSCICLNHKVMVNRKTIRTWRWPAYNPVETAPKFQKENKLKCLLQKLATVSVCQDTSVKPLSTKICDDFFHPIVHGWMTFFICCLELQKCSSLAADILYKIFNFILLLIV